MSDSVFITILLSIVLVGIAAAGLHRLMFKKSIVFRVVAIMIVPLLFGPIVGLIVGVKGTVHLWWTVPVILIIITAAFEIIARILQKPLNEMITVVESLSEGDVDVSFNEKFQKGGHELARVIRRLVKLTESLKIIAAFAEHVGKGELNVAYTLLGEKDTLGKAMLDMRSNLQKAEAEKEERHQEDERRNWVTHGVAKFADLLRANNNNIEELCHSIVCNLVKYIGANQAGIFILNDDDTEHPVLELKACYAFERRKFLQKTIGMGEGLVGTCFLERESIYMTSLPKDYVHITSGLGEDTPRALLIVPLKVNEEVYGIIEIAAFKEFEPHVREFIEKVSESIASTVGSVKVNMRTNKLLVQSKLQTEELANQEEELRQNMEEMQATQEEMRRRENELHETMKKMKETQEVGEEFQHEIQQFRDGIFNTYNVVEFSSDGIVTSINQNLVNLFQAPGDFAFIGKHLSMFVGEEAYKNAWDNIVQGKLHMDRVQVNAGERTLNIKQTFIPICDIHGKLLSITLVAVHDQETELFQNMEEMRESQAASKEKEHELEQFYKAFRDSCNFIIYSSEGVITDVNEKLLKLFNISEKSIFVGKHMSDFLGEKTCLAVMEHLTQGKSYEECQSVDTGVGGMQNFRHKFTPICDSQGELLWIISITTPENI